MNPYRILIVEDEKIIAKDLEIRLKRMNYSVAGAVTNCDDVLAMLRTRPVDLILMDIMIEGERDGIDTAFIVRQEFDIPIIFLTAYADESTFQRAKLSDPFGYILKPFQERELDLTIQTVLQKHALERRIKENEERYRRLFESTQEAILILDDEARVVDLNPSARVLYSGFGHEIVGMAMPELNGATGTDDRFAALWKTTLEEGKASGRFKITDPEGEVRYVDYSTQAHYMPGRHLVVLRDVTRKVLDQREIETLARIPAEAPSPILRLSADGRLIYANRSAELLLRTWRKDSVLALPPAFLARLRELEANGGESVFNLELESRQYSLLAVYVPKGRYINIYATDVTDKYLNEKLIAFQKDILELVALGTNLTRVLERICLGLQAFLPEAQASVVYTTNRQWHLAGSFEAGASALAEAHNGGGAALVSAAEAAGKRYVPARKKNHLADLLREQAFPRNAIAAAHVYPIHAEQGVAAALCLLWPQEREETANLADLINLGLRLLTVALERDITFRRLYNQSLAFENINDAIILTDLDGHVTEWSPAAERIFHYQKGDILGKRFHDLKIFNGSADVWLGANVHRNGAANGTGGSVATEQREASFVLPDGEHGWAEISIIDMKDPGGNLVGRLKVARDITKKKNVEKALNLSEQHLKAIFDNSVQSFILLDMEGRVVAFNRQAQKWASVPLMKGQPVGDVWQTGNEENFRQCLALARQGGMAGFEDFLPSFGGQPAWFELNFLPVVDTENEMTGICFTALDIRERKDNEVNLARSEARFRSLVQNSSDLILLCDREGVITYASESSLRITGYAPSTLVGRRLFEFTHARDKVRMVDALHKAEEQEQTGESLATEYRFLQADGTAISIEATITSRLHDPAIASLVLNNRDVSERKAAEEALRNIVQGVSGYTGEDYFTYLTENLSTYLAIPDVLLAESKSADRMEPLALVYEGQPAVWGSFDSKGLFITDVLHSGYLFVTNVSGTPYASDPLVSRFKAGTIIGVALRTTTGRNLGVMVAASPKPFQNFAMAESMLKIFSVRAATELERINATRALQASQANLSALIENTTDAIFSIDRHLHLTAVNTSFRQRFRSLFQDGAEPGDDVSKLMHPAQARNWLRWLDLALQGKRHEKDINLPWKNGEASYEVSFNPIVSEIGFVTGVSIFARDITARKMAETALRQSEANLTALIENTDDIIYSLDDRFRLITGNSSFRSAILAIEGNPGPGSREVGRLSGPIGKDWAPYYQRALNGEKFTEELTLSLDGKQKDIETSFNPITAKGKDVAGVSVFARDITERKRAENELKRTNFELDSFVYRASHDLRAPLRSVLGLINLIKLEASEAQKENYLALAEKSINKLDTFISDLTHFSRNTRLEIARVKVDFNAIIQECVENLRYMENAGRLKLNLDIQAGDFYSDPQRISILFQNMISNAIKYQRAELAEGEGYVNITAHEQDGGCLITVEDNGKGIREEYLQKIFDMFFRASEESYGSGLGLYITRQVIDKLGGWVKVDSIFGQGTTFRVFLPSLEPVAEVTEE